MRLRVCSLSLAVAICVSTALAQQEKEKSTSSRGNSAGRQVPKSEAAATPIPEPSPEIRKCLNAFSGSWSVTYKYDPSDDMPNGGAGQGEELYRPGPGGTSMIEEFHSKEATGELSGLGVAWWDEKARGYRAVWCDSRNPRGCVIMAHLANWEGNQFVLGDEWERMGKRFCFKEVFSDITSASFTQTLYQGECEGELKRLMSIRATRLTDAIPPGAKQPKQ